MPEPFIELRGVEKRFGKTRALDGVDLAIEPGAFYALLGPSGCGKTTLLRILGGFETPDAGTVSIDGEDMTAVPPYRRPVNMVFQSYAIFPHLDVFHNIAFGLRKDRLGPAELRARVEEALSLIRLEGYGNRAAHELSGGQRQRVALARALVRRPKALLLDEPLGALDKKLREAMQLELRGLQRTLGITFVLVTHDQEEALTMSDRIAVMQDGCILEEGTPGSLYARPRTRFVAEFLGAMNFADGVVREHVNGTVAVETDRLGMIQAGAADGLTPGDRIKIGIRPENMTLSQGGASAPANRAEGRLVNTSFLGDRTLCYVQTSENAEPVTVAVQGRVEPAGDGERVNLSWQSDAVLFFPHD